jgi:hypothetical protein
MVIDFASVSKTLRLDVGTVLTVWYFCFSIFFTHFQLYTRLNKLYTGLNNELTNETIAMDRYLRIVTLGGEYRYSNPRW